jgi:MFS family permease
MSDLSGRRLGLIVNAILVAIGTLVSALAFNVSVLFLGRFIAGMGMGAEISIINTYVAEITPARVRGKMTQWSYLAGAVGLMATPFIALIVIPSSVDGWRYMFGLAALIAVIIVFMRFTMPETPRWLVLKGKITQAQKIVSEMEDYVKRKGLEIPSPQAYPPQVYTKRFPTREILSRKYASRLTVITVFWFLVYFASYASISFVPLIFVSAGFQFFSTLAYLGTGAVGYLIGALVMPYFADLWERKYLMMVSCVPSIAAALLDVVALDYHNLFLLGTATFLVTVNTALLGVCYAYTAELFPTRARATGFALSDGIGHIGGIMGPLLFSTLVVTTASRIIPTSVTFFILLGAIDVVAALVLLAGPRTSRKRLEEISP